MWAFLVTEILFFGGMFTAYVVYRALFTRAFVGASNLLDIRLGAVNTAVLIVSSLTMAIAVWAAAQGRRNRTILFLVLTIFLGSVFLAVKVVEYAQKFEHHEVPGAHFVVPEGLTAAGGAVLLALLLHDRAARAAHGHWRGAADVADPPDPPGRLLAGSTTHPSRWSASTGTSSTSSGSSSSRSFTFWGGTHCERTR